MWWPPEQQAILDETIKTFPEEFGLRAFPGDRFRISEHSSYFSGKTLYLYTEIAIGDKWLSFAKGTPAQLRREIINL
jgi:hypothetical protein